MATEKNWYVIYLQEHWEKKVLEALERKKIETYCPSIKIRKQAGDKNPGFIYKPLFAHFVFVQITEPEINLVKHIEGVLHFLYWLGGYAIISREDIDTMKGFIAANHNVWPEKAQVGPENRTLVQPEKDFEITGYPANKMTRKIFLPTLGYFLQAQEESIKEILQHAI